MATRTSSRVPRDGVPIAEKAARRAQERDELSSNPFTILNNHSNESLRKIALDLDIADSFIEENLTAIKAEELVRADIAQAQYRAYLASLRNREIPPGEEDAHCLGLERIDNSSRELEPDSLDATPSGVISLSSL